MKLDIQLFGGGGASSSASVVYDNVIPRNFTKAIGRFKVETSAGTNLNDRYEITKDEFGDYRGTNLRTGETYTMFKSMLQNGEVFEFEGNEIKKKRRK